MISIIPPEFGIFVAYQLTTVFIFFVEDIIITKSNWHKYEIVEIVSPIDSKNSFHVFTKELNKDNSIKQKFLIDVSNILGKEISEYDIVGFEKSNKKIPIKKGDKIKIAIDIRY